MAEADYDILLTKFHQSQAECRQLKQKLTTTEAELKNLENALAPAVTEYDQLRRKLQIESECRSEAEKYASKMKKSNTALKRRSLQMMQQMQLVNIDIDDVDSGIAGIGSEEDVRDGLNRKIQELEESVRELESKLEAAEEEKITAYNRETKLVVEMQELEDENSDLREKVEDYKNNMKNIKRASNLAWKEYEELQKSLELAVQLKNEAERYAHQMLAERDVIKRESAMLMASAASNERLSSALLTVEELTVQLANEQHAHKTQVDALKQELDSSSLTRRIEELEKQLSMALSENHTLHKSFKDLEKWKVKLEKENVDLTNKLDVAEQMLRPPPPPPPPPPSLFSPLRLFIKKKPASETSTKTKAGTARDQTYEEALKEMMERIKTGRALKPTVETQESDKTDGSSSSSSAFDNLQNILTRRQVPLDDLIQQQKQRQQTQQSRTDNELMATFKRVRLRSENGTL